MLIRRAHLLRAYEKANLAVGIRAAAAVLFPPSRAKTANEVRVFLSHKHSEWEILRNAMALFLSADAELYIDWQDNAMPSATSGETAMRIRSKIAECGKFVLLASDDAISSKWCIWELGIADALKYPGNMALLPVADDDGTWKGAEDLQIYSHIETEYQYHVGEYVVVTQERRMPLSDWLRS